MILELNRCILAKYQVFFGRRDGLRMEFDELYSSLFTNPEPYIKIILLNSLCGSA